jgi:hypothetical protein
MGAVNLSGALVLASVLSDIRSLGWEGWDLDISPVRATPNKESVSQFKIAAKNTEQSFISKNKHPISQNIHLWDSP